MGHSDMRRKLPEERLAIVHKFSVAGHEGYLTVGLYPDKTPGELFISMSKQGSTISGVMDSFAIMVSLGLQYGIPLDVIVDKLSFQRFEPSGFTQNAAIRQATSIIDYIARWLGQKFVPGFEPEDPRSDVDREDAIFDAGTPVATDDPVPASGTVPVAEAAENMSVIRKAGIPLSTSGRREEGGLSDASE